MGLKEIVIVGCGGHAKVATAAIEATGQFEIRCYVDRHPEPGTSFRGRPVVDEDAFSTLDGALAVHVAIGDNALRKEVVDRLRGIEWLRFPTIVHPCAIVDDSVRVGRGSLIMPGAIVNPDTVVGAFTILNTRCTVEHDCSLGDFAQVGPSATLCGGCRVGAGTLIGAGATLVPGQTVGDWSTIGAGAVVVTAIPDNVVAVGVPAKIRGS